MNKKMIFRTLMIIGVLANVILPLTFSNTGKDYASLPLVTCRSKGENSFSIDLPAGWKTVSQDLAAVGTTLICRSPSGLTISATCSFIADLKANMPNPLAVLTKQNPLKSAHESSVAIKQDLYRDYKELESQTYQLNGQDAFITKYTFTSTRGFVNKKMGGVVVTTYNGSAPITIEMACSVKEFDQAFALFQKCLNSYKPSGPAPKPEPAAVLPVPDGTPDPNAGNPSGDANTPDVPNIPVPEGL